MTNVTRAVPLTTPVLRSFGNPASIGANTLVAAVSGKKIRLLSAHMVSVGANSAKFVSGSTDIGGTFAFAANGGMVLDFNEHGWYETAAGEALVLNLSAATAVGISFQYMVL